MASRTRRLNLADVAELRAHGQAQSWSLLRIAEAISERFGVSRLEAHRLARGWTRRQAVEAILATYNVDGLARPSLTTQRLCAWERNPKVRPGEDYRDRLCRVYETRSEQLGYGHDYTPPAEAAELQPAAIPVLTDQMAQPAVRVTDDATTGAYPGAPAAPLALTTGSRGADNGLWQPNGQENAANRGQFLHVIGVGGVAMLLDRAGRAAVRLSGKLAASNLGPVTLEQLELRIVGILHSYEHTSSGQRLAALLAQLDDVEALLDGRQTLDQRRALHRIVGQLSALLGGTAWELGDYPTAHAHLLTAWQLAQQVGDDALIARVRVTQATVALWAGDFPAAIDYAHDGQRYATGAQRASLAARCEARAYARLGQRAKMLDALGRAERAMPSQPATDDPDAAWDLLSPAALQLYTGMALLWLGDTRQAEPDLRQSITGYQTQPPLLQSPANQAQAHLTLAACLVRRGHPEEGIRLAAGTLGIDRGHVEPNLQQASEFLAALPAAHRDLDAARQLADQLRTIRTPPSTLDPS